MQLNNSVETQTKVVPLHAYLNNQAMIKRILFTVHQNLNKPKTGRLRLFVDLFIPFCVIIVRAFFFFAIKIQTFQDKTVPSKIFNSF